MLSEVMESFLDTKDAMFMSKIGEGRKRNKQKMGGNEANKKKDNVRDTIPCS